MAYDMRTSSRTTGHGEVGMFEDLSKIQLALAGHYFEQLAVWQRVFVRGMLTLAAKTVSTGRHEIQLTPKGWGIAECVTAPIVAESQPTEPTLHDLIQRSYDHDMASQKARVALRPFIPEADDRYFESDDADTGEYLPALVKFREKALFTLQGV